jgi:hypothetical protein
MLQPMPNLPRKSLFLHLYSTNLYKFCISVMYTNDNMVHPLNSPYFNTLAYYVKNRNLKIINYKVHTYCFDLWSNSTDIQEKKVTLMLKLLYVTLRC